MQAQEMPLNEIMQLSRASDAKLKAAYPAQDRIKLGAHYEHHIKQLKKTPLSVERMAEQLAWRDMELEKLKKKPKSAPLSEAESE